MTDLMRLSPKDEAVWATYYFHNEFLFFLTAPVAMSSTITAQAGKITLYAVNGNKAKKLGSGSNPSELERKFGVPEKVKG
ncbi:MAG: hypothetical protein IJQ02_11970 [Oscillospiraceae bacterium]|nr:hypothetical protein [Oscillospiraceae bacterium]